LRVVLVLSGAPTATAALHSAAPRITFFIGPPFVLKITDDVASCSQDHR
jgi:hypothetical protein